MSKTIWKYALPRDGQTIEIHEHIVKVLNIATQDGVPTLWAIVDPDRPRDGYTEVVAWGTGWPLPDDVYAECDYWGTCGDAYGYIWHYFAATRLSERNDWTESAGNWNTLTTAKEYLNDYRTTCSAATVTIPGNYINSAQCDGVTWTLASVPTEITLTADNTKMDMDALINMVEKYVTGSNTATNSACR